MRLSQYNSKGEEENIEVKNLAEAIRIAKKDYFYLTSEYQYRFTPNRWKTTFISVMRKYSKVNGAFKLVRTYRKKRVM